MTTREELMALADRAEKEGYAGLQLLEYEIFRDTGGFAGTFMGRRIDDHTLPIERVCSVITDDGVLHERAKRVPRYFASVEDANTLAPEGCNYLSGRGRLRPEEPLFGCLVFRGASNEAIGQGESNASEACARTAAFLRARAALMPDDGK